MFNTSKLFVIIIMLVGLKYTSESLVLDQIAEVPTVFSSSAW